MRWPRRLLGPRLPDALADSLERDEDVAAVAVTSAGGHLAVTQLGLWVPGESADDGPRRIGWHLISKATWSGDSLTVTEAEVTGQAGDAVLLADRAPVRYVLPQPGKLPQQVRQRVESSIRSRYHKDLSHDGVWFVVRKVPGRDGSVLQARPDQGADAELVAEMAREAARKLA